jgi:hypothetical protein
VEAALIVSLVAVGIALGSFALAVRADRRAGRADRRDTRRLQREEAAERRRGKPVVVPSPVSGTLAANCHEYEVRNPGNAAITEVQLWIVDSEKNVVSTRAGGQNVLAPGELAFMTVEVTRAPRGEQDLMVQWRDADGEEHTESTGIRPLSAHPRA